MLISNAATQGQPTYAPHQNNKAALLNFNNALVRFKKQLMKDHIPFADHDFYINQRRYKIMEIDDLRYLVIFKRDFFNTYGREFNDDMIGETINREDLKKALANNCTYLLYLYEDGKIYYVHIGSLIDKWHLRETKAEGKEEYAFGISNLRRWE